MRRQRSEVFSPSEDYTIMPFSINGALIAALIAPVMGAMLYPALHTLPTATRLFDRFMFIAVPLLILFHIFSHAWPGELIIATMLVLGGLAAPLLLERASSYFAKKVDSTALAVGISGLAVHVIIESAVLRGDSTDLVLALVLHRLGVGLMVYWLVRPTYGFWMASLSVLALLVATLLGFTLLGNIMADNETAELYQYFVSGSLLHVIFHRSLSDHRHDHNYGSHSHN